MAHSGAVLDGLEKISKKEVSGRCTATGANTRSVNRAADETVEAARDFSWQLQITLFIFVYRPESFLCSFCKQALCVSPQRSQPSVSLKPATYCADQDWP